MLIADLSRQVDMEHNPAGTIAKQLAEYHESAREVAKAQKVFRQKT